MGNLIIPGETALCGRLYKDWLSQYGLDDKAPEPVEAPAVGLCNLRNLCFLNAILQCLYHTPMLRRNLALALESTHVKDEWLCSLFQIFQELDRSRKTKMPVVATRIAGLIQVASTNGEFQQGQQADAHEAFMVLIAKLLNGCICPKGVSFSEREQLEQSSLIGHVFGMSLSQSVRCMSCKDESTTTRAEYCLCVTCTPISPLGDRAESRQGSSSQKKLPGNVSAKARALVKRTALPKANQKPSEKSDEPVQTSSNTVVGVTDLLRTYTQGEEIAEWKCEKCLKRGCTRQTCVSRPPNVLLIHISRLQEGVTPQVVVDSELDLSRFTNVKADGSIRYTLLAVIVYKSLGSGGHYFAYVRSGRDGKSGWCIVDDDDVRSATWSEVQQEDPYMLVFERNSVAPPICTDKELRLQEEQTRLQKLHEEEQARAKAEEEARLKAEDARRKAEEEARIQAERKEQKEAARLKAEKEARVKEEEEEEEEARLKAEEEAHLKAKAEAEEETRRKLEEETRLAEMRQGDAARSLQVSHRSMWPFSSGLWCHPFAEPAEYVEGDVVV
eukprot:TRINITY_DN2739_c1_g1_i1.p1 TRINITY_DN2739_c1_g1~~TRINITY_DN2739_c1_g1_i1.p1  ORF type:complete len:557 (-),score=127.58 TRINITY_DN2739_c1_g1_i1:13-1683(-)